MMKGLLHSLLWLVEFAVGLAIILAVLLLIMPWLISYDGTRATVLSLLKGTLKAEVTIEKAQLSWWDKTDIQELCYKSNDGKLAFSCKELSTPSSLWMILFGEHNLGELRIDSPSATFLLEPMQETTATHEKKALQAAGLATFPVTLPFFAKLDLHKAWQKITPHLKGAVNLYDGQIAFEGKNLENVRIENIAFEAKLAHGSDNIHFKLSGTTRQGEKRGNLDWSGNFGPLDRPDPTLSIEGSFKSLPIIGVDQITALFYPQLKGVLLTTIGSDIDLTMQLTISSQNFDLSYDASSMLFNATARVITQNEQIVLAAPARFGLTLTPYLAEKFFSLSPYMRGLSMANSPRVTLDISDLVIPLIEEGINWRKLKIRALVNLLDLKFATPVLFNGIELERLKASISSDQLDQELLFDTTTTLSLDEKKALVAASGAISHTLAKKSSITLAISTQTFPVAILDKIFATKGFLQDAVGPTCDFTFAIDRDNDIRTGILYFLSPTVTLNNANLRLYDEGSVLNSPIRISFSPPRQFWERHMRGIGSGAIEILVEKFETSRGDLSQLKVVGTATSPQAFYKGFSLPNPILNFNIQTYSSIALNLQSEGLTATANISYNKKDKTFATTDPSSLSFNLTPEQATSLWKEFATPPIFLAPFVANATVKPFVTPLGQNFLNNVSIEGIFNAPYLSIEAPNKTTAIVKNCLCNCVLNTKSGEFRGKFDADIGSEEAKLVPLHGECLVRKLHFQPKINMSDAEILFKLGFENLDTRFIDAWRAGQAKLTPLLGSWLSIKGELLQAPSTGVLNLDATCENGSFHLNLAKQDDQLILAKSQPLTATLAIDKKGFQAIQDFLGQKFPVTLDKPCTIDMQISNLNLPLQTGSMKINSHGLPQATMDCTLQTESFSFIESLTKKPITLSHLAFRLARPDLKSPLTLSLRTSVDAVKPGQVDIKANLRDIHHNKEGWDFSQIQAQINANFQQLPTSVADTVTTAMGLKTETLTALLGDQISGSATANIANCSGPIAVNINSPSTRVALDGTLQNGVLVLNQSLIAQITMTEAISRRFLQSVNPLSIAAIQSDGPMTLTVAKEGFSLPIFPWNLEAARINSARIELGKITCRNQGNIHTALDLLKLGQFSRSNTLTVWFAPLDFTLQKGVIYCDRTEFLVDNSIDLATWGEIDLINNRVDAVLGLTAQALSKAFGIKDLPDNYVLKIPMKGPIDNVKIDSGKATSKIALLLAWQTAAAGAGGAIGGPGGALVGGLLNKMAKLPDSNADIPPAKHPFPWEQQPSSSSKIPPKKKKSAIRPGDKPLKQLLKLLK